MEDDAFRAFLMPAQTPGSVSSYLANLRRVERTLRINLDEIALNEAAILQLGAGLASHGVERASLSNCLSAVRKYATFKSRQLHADTGAGGHDDASCRRPALEWTGHAQGSGAQRRSITTSSRAEMPRCASALTLRSVPELMGLYAAIMGELRHRGVLRTGNGPIGDYAEMLFAEAFGWTLSGNSTAGHDAVDPAGTRYQIKARRLGTATASRQLGALRKLPERPFDQLAVAMFDRDMSLLRAAILPMETVLLLARRVEHTNSWRLMMSDSVWSMPGVRDATSEIRSIIGPSSVIG